MKIKDKFAEISGVMAALLIAVVGLAVVIVVASFVNVAQKDENITTNGSTGVNTTIVNPTVYTLAGLVLIIFIIIVVYMMIKKVQD